MSLRMVVRGETQSTVQAGDKYFSIFNILYNLIQFTATLTPRLFETQMWSNFQHSYLEIPIMEIYYRKGKTVNIFLQFLRYVS